MKKTFTKTLCLAFALLSFGSVQAQQDNDVNDIFKLGVEDAPAKNGRIVFTGNELPEKYSGEQAMIDGCFVALLEEK